MERFCIDESGYTGFDLLNAEQPFQGASSICISEEDARDAIQQFFPRLQASELKYRALARRPGNAERLLGLQQYLLKNFKCVTYVAHKRFLLTLMFIDYAVEPYYYERGFNLYQDGENYLMGSALFHAGEKILGPGYNTILSSFQSAMKLKTAESMTQLLRSVATVSWKDFPEALGPLALHCPDCISAIMQDGVTTDAALIVLQSLITRMEMTSSGPYRVDHDRSKNLTQYHDLLQQFIGHKDPVEFRQSEIASIRFPLNLVSVEQVDSKDCLGVQLADILIGGATDFANAYIGQRKKTDYTEGVLSAYAEDQLIHMLPSRDFEGQKKFRMGTQANELIEYFSKNFRS